MNTIELKLTAMTMAIEMAGLSDDTSKVNIYETAGAIYEWFMEDAVLKEKPPAGDGQGVLKFPN